MNCYYKQTDKLMATKRPTLSALVYQEFLTAFKDLI